MIIKLFMLKSYVCDICVIGRDLKLEGLKLLADRTLQDCCVFLVCHMNHPDR